MTDDTVQVSFPEVFHDDESGRRIVVADSLSFYEHEPWTGDVALGASFSGEPTAAMAMRGGVRAWIGHQGGPGLDGAGSAGLWLAESHGVPAAVVGTMTARLADGRSLLRGRVAERNSLAAALGVEEGDSGEDAARKLLDAPEGRSVDFGDRIDDCLHEIDTPAGAIAAVWSFSRVDPERHRYPVYCVASHGATTMAYYAMRVRPRGLICNDAGMGLDRSGISGLPVLDGYGIAAAAVSADTARIGDALSTFHDGVLSAVNDRAYDLGLRVRMPASEAALRMLTSE